jgi:chemotaxis protein CheY-P-specific phosphatase CheC
MNARPGHLDVFTELINVGVGRAASAMGDITDLSVQVSSR